MSTNTNSSVNLRGINTAIERQRKELSNLLNTIKMTEPSRALADSIAHVEKELAKHEAKRKSFEEELKPLEPVTEEQVKRYLDDLHQVMESGTSKQRRELLRQSRQRRRRMMIFALLPEP